MVVGLLGDVDEALLQLVLLQDAVQLVEETHPLVPLLVAVGQDEDGGLVAAGGGQLGRSHLGGERVKTNVSHVLKVTLGGVDLKQGFSLCEYILECECI